MANEATDGAAREVSLVEDAVSLADALSAIAGHFGIRRSAGALKTGFPLTQSGDIPEERLADAAERVGLTCRVADRRRLTPLDMPAIAVDDGMGPDVITQIAGGRGEPSFVTSMRRGRVAAADYFRGFDGRLYSFSDDASAVSDGRVSERSLGQLIRSSLWANRSIYGQILIGTFAVNLLGLSIPLFIMNVYDRVVPTQALESLWVLSIGVVLAGLFDVGLRQLRGYLTDVAGRRMDVVLGNRVIDHLLQARFDHVRASSGSIAHSVRELDSLREFFNSSTLVALGDLPFLALFLFILWLVAGPLAFVPMVGIPLILLTSLALQPLIIAHMNRAHRNAANRNSVLFDILSGLETLKSMGAESFAARRWEKAHAANLSSAVPIRGLSLLNANLILAGQVAITVIMVIYGVYGIARGELSQGALIAAILLSGRAMAPVGQLVQAIGRLHGAVIAYRALKPLVEAPVERPAGEHFIQPEQVSGAIRFNAVDFAYPAPPGQKGMMQPTVKVLSAFSLTIRAGEKIAIVGPIGSGKTTLVKLVLGLYRASSGRVLVDDLDVARIEPAELRRAIGYVPQVPQFFQGTIRDNLILHHPGASDREILAAMQGAGAAGWLQQCPLGLDQPVGEHGSALSGGQRQSLALARALLKDPPILLLDEPTSQLDSRTEAAFIEHLKSVAAERTLLVVTHRPALLSLVDRLVVVDRGQIAAEGPKQDVLRRLGQGTAA
ncbi:type I secretion system permease/ATPase [Stappia sp. F7233]|uniref:Type I secretion system permease/ATPase n=1 Tax=Stappia albiluteola TaxID=2758565 RepID=A0A839AGT4_9HYPH|nr:type I secretion system permease/ATPase [Stappia albiluteola]MBA5778248.1 type I secretion system permease/ATPase [Stappia albiluteola]